MKRLVHASLFSGIGGFDLAAEWSGFNNAFNCEIDQFCTKILKYHFPNSEHYDDIKKTDFTKWRGKIDILTGGFPCQPFSLAGNRKGTEDDRYLWPQMLRAIREIQPSWVVGENVAGILSMVQPSEDIEVERSSCFFGEDNIERTTHRQKYIIETICKDIEREGYSVQPFIIPACSVGAPHRRDRVWIIAHRNIDRQREWPNKQKSFAKRIATSNDCNVSSNWITSNSDEHRSTSCESCEGAERRRENELPLSGEREIRSKRINGLYGLSQDVSNTHSKRCQKWNTSTEPNKKKSTLRDYKKKISRIEWEKFPTQSPVCSRDDGFPIPMDGITFPKWRQESIKAYGNAIVPQVAYEIFQAIINSYE